MFFLLPLPSELLLASNVYHFFVRHLLAGPRLLSIWECLDLCESESLWRKVWIGKHQMKCFEPSQCVGLCYLVYLSSTSSPLFVITCLDQYILFLWLGSIDPSKFWTSRKKCLLSFSGILACRSNSFHLMWPILKPKSVGYAPKQEAWTS